MPPALSRKVHKNDIKNHYFWEHSLLGYTSLPCSGRMSENLVTQNSFSSESALISKHIFLKRHHILNSINSLSASKILSSRVSFHVQQGVSVENQHQTLENYNFGIHLSSGFSIKNTVSFPIFKFLRFQFSVDISIM